MNIFCFFFLYVCVYRHRSCWGGRAGGVVVVDVDAVVVVLFFLTKKRWNVNRTRTPRRRLLLVYFNNGDSNSIDKFNNDNKNNKINWKKEEELGCAQELVSEIVIKFLVIVVFGDGVVVSYIERKQNRIRMNLLNLLLQREFSCCFCYFGCVLLCLSNNFNWYICQKTRRERERINMMTFENSSRKNLLVEQQKKNVKKERDLEFVANFRLYTSLLALCSIKSNYGYHQLNVCAYTYHR